LDVLSGGRAWLGIGAAWNHEESAGLGIPFPPVAERFERLEETLQIVTQMFTADPEPFSGRHYQLARPLNSPAPLTRPRPPIMIGGMGEKKTLRLVARYADACNFFVGPELERKLDVLREHCAREGRDFASIYRTAYLPLTVGADGSGVDELLTRLRGLADLGIDAVLGFVPEVHTLRPLEVIGRDVIPVAAGFAPPSS
jgi:alkanesulfonate monooxygenase SsuD/methylene tetrahydromethanopterin reductase-like flavin-dependent oxidoreductase (luciferase family)